VIFTRKKAGEAEDHCHQRTSLRGSKDENPPPVDIEVPRKGKKGDWTSRVERITSESDNKIARKESRTIISNKVCFLIKLKHNTHSPEQDKRLSSEKVADDRAATSHRQVALTSIPTTSTSKPRPDTRNTGSGVLTSQVPESDISDQVPGGKRQVPAHSNGTGIRYVPCCLASRPPHVHS